MLKKLTEFLLTFSAYFFPSEEQLAPPQPEDYFMIVEEARQEWQSAKERFDQISDPDLIDHAIYDLEAAERRYVYLLKKLKKRGLNFIQPRMKGVVKK